MYRLRSLALHLLKRFLALPQIEIFHNNLASEKLRLWQGTWPAGYQRVCECQAGLD